MSKQRYEISDADWELVADLFHTHRRTGRPRADDRLMLNGVSWVLCSGTTCRDMPERYGPCSTVYLRFRDWRNQGTFNKMLKRMQVKLNEQGLIDLDT
jgi:transposase